MRAGWCGTMRTRGRWWALVALVGIGAGLLPAAPALAATAVVSAPALTPPAASAGATPAGASNQAVTGQPAVAGKHFDAARSKEVPTLDARTRQWDNPDGTHTLRIGSGPVEGVDAAGVRGPLDLSLLDGGDGWLRPHRTTTPVSLARVSGAVMASVELGPNQSAKLSMDGVRSGVVPARTPSAGGDSMRYSGALASGASVEMRALSDGVESTYEVSSAAAAASLTEDLQLPGGDSFRQAGPQIELVDGSGAVVGHWQGGVATDASSPGGGGGGAVSLVLQSVSGSRASARVVVDPRWLADAKRVWPVRVDPKTVRSNTDANSTYIDSLFNNQPYDGAELWMGCATSSGCSGGGEVAQTLIQFPLSGIPSSNTRIVGATMQVDEMWSWSCSPRAMEAHQVTQSWPNNVSWASRPSFNAAAESSINVASGFSSSCAESWQTLDLSPSVADWYYHNQSDNFGVLLKAQDETDPFGWKKFRGASTGNGPVLDVTYETYGPSPIAVNDANTVPPTSDPGYPGWQGMTLTNSPQATDTWPANGAYRISYHLYRSDGTYLRDGVETSMPSDVAPGGSVTLNANIESLPMGDYILKWDLKEYLPNGQAIWLSSFGAATVSRSYHSDQRPTQATLVSPVTSSNLISETPTLTAASTDPDGPRLQYLFRICTGSDAESGSCADSGWQDGSAWQVPRGVLTWGTTYYWHAWVRDNFPNPGSVVGPPAPFSYTPVLPVPQAPWAFGADPYVNYQDGVNTALGSYVYTTTDLSVPTVGPPLELVRTYNSLDQDTGISYQPGNGLASPNFGRWFGTGWSSTYETSLAFDPVGNMVVNYADGRKEFLQSNGDGTFQPAFGFVTSVTEVVNNGGGVNRIAYYQIKQRDQTMWQFTPDGRLDSVTDPQGHKAQLAWTRNGSGGCCTQLVISDRTSGRSLTVAFTAPGDLVGRVSSVVTSPVTVNGSLQQLKWTYGYDSNHQLQTACDPTGACTTYTNGGPQNQLTGIKRPNANSPMTLTYDNAHPNRVATLKDGLGNPTTYSYQSTPAAGAPAGSTRTTAVTDALGHVQQSSYNQLNQLLQHVNADGTAKTYTYDQGGFLNLMTDENGHTTTYSNDSNSNVTQAKDASGGIAYRTYDAQNHLLTYSDPRSGGPSDTTYQTTYSYDSAGDLIGQKTPAGTWSWKYSQGSEAAVGGGVVPANLMLSATDAMNHVTTYAYDSRGDMVQRTDPSGLVTRLTYDELGRQTSTTQISDTYPGGLVTTAGYDLAGRLSVLSEPQVANTVSGATHMRVSTLAYDGDGNVSSVTVSDGVGGDAARKTSYTYDANDRLATVTDALGSASSISYDAIGNVTQRKDALGRVTQTTYTVRDQPSQVTLLNYVDSGGVTRNLTLATYTYDAAGRKQTATDGLGRRLSYGYDVADRLQTLTLQGYHNPDGSTRDVVLQRRGYDAAGELTSLTVGGLRTTTYGYDPAGRPTTTAVVVGATTRTTTNAYDANGNVVSTTLTDGSRTEQTTYQYDLDQASRLARVTVGNGGGTNDLVTSYTRDQQAQVIAMTDPRGSTTTYSYDPAGRLMSTVGPAVQVESGGSAPASLQPAEAQGYDTFGELTQARDARGNVTSHAYDALGRQTGISYPTYVTPGGVTVNASESWVYDAVGNVLRWTDRRGQLTTYAYSMRNLVTVQTDPKVTGQAVQGVISYSYDDVGNLTGVKDQVGAQRSFSYDDRNRVRGSTRLVSQGGSPPSSAAYLTSYDYDDLGDQSYVSTPLGEATRSQYNQAGELTQVTDPLGHVTRITRDVEGRPVQTTDPLGRSAVSTYDLAGRLTQRKDLDSSGAVLATTSYQRDAAGNVVAMTDPVGHTTTYGYDALKQLTRMTEPTTASSSVTTSFGYDASGNRTRVTDGNGNPTVMTYNAWDLLETRVLPSTASNPALSDRTWTYTYDAGGLPTSEAQPGVGIASTYDELGRLTAQAGTSAGATTTSTYGYDLTGKVISAGGTAGSQAFAYDERGLVTASSGVAGSSSFRYDGDGQLTSRADGSGTASFGYDATGNLTSVHEPLTGVQETLGYDAAGQLTSVGYGSGGPARSNGYDGLGNVTSDAVRTAAGALVLQGAYTYDANGNEKTRTLSTSTSSGTDSFGYDYANRLVSWTDPTGSLTTYGWDGAGNRTQVGSTTYTYDQRNRLTSGNGVTYSWTANGNLAQEQGNSATTTYTYDGLGRLVSDQAAYLPPLSGGSSTTYAYDGLDRVVQRNGTGFTYAGQGQVPVTDGSFKYSQGPGGELLASSNGTPFLDAQDRHGDLSLTFDASGNAENSPTYDPFGRSIPHYSSSSPAPPNLGFQGEYTDPTTGKVLMGARWYDGSTGRFLTGDSIQPPISGSVDTNLYAYGRANPLGNTDPSGHCPNWIPSGLACDLWDHFDPPKDCIWACLRPIGPGDAPLGSDECWSDDLGAWVPCPPPGGDSPPPSCQPGSPDCPTNGNPAGSGNPGGGNGPRGGQRHLAPPPIQTSNGGGLGGGRVFLPPGATLASTGSLLLAPVTRPALPPSTSCNACTQLMNTMGGALHWLPGAFNLPNPSPGGDGQSDHHGCDVQSGARHLGEWLEYCQPSTIKNLNPDCFGPGGGRISVTCSLFSPDDPVAKGLALLKDQNEGRGVVRGGDSSDSGPSAGTMYAREDAGMGAGPGGPGPVDRLLFGESSKHPDVLPEPAQAALDQSIQVSTNSTRRVGVDYASRRFMVFDETHPGQGIFHGHYRAWSELRPEQQALLRRWGMATKRGEVA